MSAPNPEPNRTPEKKSRKGLAIGLGAGAAGIALAAGAVFGINALNTAPKNEPIAEAPADPTEEAPQPTPEKDNPLPSEMELEIPAGLSAEQAGETIIQRIAAWYNAGTDNQQIIDDWYAFNGSTGDYVTDLATNQFAPEFADALFISGWQSHDDLARLYNVMNEVDAHTLELNLITNDPANGDIEPFRNIKTTDAVREVSSASGTRILEVDFTNSSNADKNRVGEDFGSQDDPLIDVESGTYVITLVTVDGTERISAIDGSYN